MEFSRPEYWSGLPFPPPGDLLAGHVYVLLLILLLGAFTCNQGSLQGNCFHLQILSKSFKIIDISIAVLSWLSLALCNPMDCSPPGSSVHGILQARILEWVAISSSRGSSQPRDRTQVSCIAGRFFTDWAMREARVNLIRFYFLLLYFCFYFCCFRRLTWEKDATIYVREQFCQCFLLGVLWYYIL